jgi:hypothetical protein
VAEFNVGEEAWAAIQDNSSRLTSVVALYSKVGLTSSAYDERG